MSLLEEDDGAFIEPEQTDEEPNQIKYSQRKGVGHGKKS